MSAAMDMVSFPAAPSHLRCSHPGCDAWGSVRWYLPRGLERPEPGPLFCVACSALPVNHPSARPSPARPMEAPRQGALL